MVNRFEPVEGKRERHSYVDVVMPGFLDVENRSSSSITSWPRGMGYRGVETERGTESSG